MPQDEIVIELAPADQDTLDTINATFKDEEVIQSSGFDGSWVVSIITTLPVVLRLAYHFYAKHKDSLKSAKVKINGKSVELEGFSADEINEMVEKGTIEKIQEKLKK